MPRAIVEDTADLPCAFARTTRRRWCARWRSSTPTW